VLLKPLEPDFDRAAAEAEPGNWYQTDGSLRDEERIPLKTDIDGYFAKEVLPYAQDAWMDRSKDEVGYEISFTKYFYEYRPPRELKDILADLEALDREADHERVVEVRRWLSNYQELKGAIEAVCELNHDLLRPQRTASKPRRKPHD
jgi:hypothetical protein